MEIQVNHNNQSFVVCINPIDSSSFVSQLIATAKAYAKTTSKNFHRMNEVLAHSIKCEDRDVMLQIWAKAFKEHSHG